jgi:hypothetical protein
MMVVLVLKMCREQNFCLIGELSQHLLKMCYDNGMEGRFVKSRLNSVRVNPTACISNCNKTHFRRNPVLIPGTSYCECVFLWFSSVSSGNCSVQTVIASFHITYDSSFIIEGRLNSVRLR